MSEGKRTILDQRRESAKCRVEAGGFQPKYKISGPFRRLRHGSWNLSALSAIPAWSSSRRMTESVCGRISEE
jgi:hypothetical protein